MHHETRFWRTRMSGTLLVLFAISALFLSGCDTTVNETTTPEQPFDATGTLSGRVIDRVTSVPVSGALIRVDAQETLSARTGSGGAFSISGLPATRSEGGSTASGTYNLHVATPTGSPYREFYTAEVELVFGGAGNGEIGSGPGTNLGASVTFPLSKLNGSLTGSLFTVSDFNGDELPLIDQEVVLYQDLDLRYTADGSGVDSDRVRVASTRTGTDGSFSFDNVEEAASYDIELAFDGAPGQQLRSGTLDPGENPSRTFEPIDVSSTIPDFTATLVSPNRRADVDTAEPEFIIAFNRPVAANAYTTPGDPLSTSGPANITDDIFIDGTGSEGPTPKARRTDDEIAVNVAFNSTRDTLTITPVDPLQDGTEYQLDVGGLFNDSAGFVDEYGRGIDRLPGGAEINFSIGINTDTPDAPNVSVTDVTPEDRDYFSGSVTARLEFTPGDNSVPVREYEIYRRTADTDDAPGVGDDDFELVTTVSATNTSFGVITATNSATGSPFYGDDGSDYEPVAWYFRAISINGVAGEASSIIEVGDNVGVGLTSTTYLDTDADGTYDALRLRFDEPIPSFPTDASTFATIDGANAPSIGNVLEIDAGRQQVIVDIFGGTPASGTDTVEISDLSDYAGNGVDIDENDITIF
ncbi:MAG: hypothetical protein GVY25_02565 [Bacteroidetes bacterium]|jgi:hypothetical protein|nr:hypothetical protein [Bacteroidota bacterium]